MTQPTRESMLAISYQQVVFVEKEEGFLPYRIFSHDGPWKGSCGERTAIVMFIL